MKRNKYTFPDIFVGLDIGTTKVATVIGYINEHEKIEVIGFGKVESTGVQHGVIQNITKTINGINQSIDVASTRSQVEVNEVYTGIAGRHIKNNTVKHEILRIDGKNSVIEQEEIDRMIEEVKNILLPANEKVITVIPQTFYIDSERETSDPVGEMGELIVGIFQVIIGNELEIKKIYRSINGANKIIKEIILEPLASGIACLTQDEKDRGVMLVDIGGGTTDVAIFHQGSPIFTEVIPFGGEVITRDIALGCRITQELAEKIKIEHGTCIVEKSNHNNIITIPSSLELGKSEISEHHLALIIEARVKEVIINPIKKILESNNYADKIHSGIVITGGGAMLKNLKELFQYSFAKTTRVGNATTNFGKTIHQELKHPMYATALGLLKYGISSTNKLAEPEQTHTITKETINGDKKMIFKKIHDFLMRILETTE